MRNIVSFSFSIYQKERVCVRHSFPVVVDKVGCKSTRIKMALYFPYLPYIASYIIKTHIFFSFFRLTAYKILNLNSRKSVKY